MFPYPTTYKAVLFSGTRQTINYRIPTGVDKPHPLLHIQEHPPPITYPRTHASPAGATESSSDAKRSRRMNLHSIPLRYIRVVRRFHSSHKAHRAECVRRVRSWRLYQKRRCHLREASVVHRLTYKSAAMEFWRYVL